MLCPLKYYLENYSPPSPKVTFTFGKTSFEWNPKYLAAVSPVYSTIPQCSEFEINERNTIISRSAAEIFHRIMPHIQDWDALHQNSSPSELDELRKVHGRWNVTGERPEDIYTALELCNYLGIKVNSR